MKILPLCLAGFLSCSLASAQKKLPIEFGAVAVSDFNLPTITAVDRNINAVVVSDVGTIRFIGNRKGWFTLAYQWNTRIKILNNRAFSLATVEIPLYAPKDSPEMLMNVKASTYNLENGHVIETSLDNKTVFEDRPDREYIGKKFTVRAT